MHRGRVVRGDRVGPAGGVGRGRADAVGVTGADPSAGHPAAIYRET